MRLRAEVEGPYHGQVGTIHRFESNRGPLFSFDHLGQSIEKTGG